jgi:hypothetical protein
MSNLAHSTCGIWMPRKGRKVAVGGYFVSRQLQHQFIDPIAQANDWQFAQFPPPPHANHDIV